MRSASKHPIPTSTNLVMSAGVLVGMPFLLWCVTHTALLPVRLMALVAFCLMGQTLFALIHEAEHGHLLPSKRHNELLGVLLSALFPGSFSVLRAGHLVHHRRNRTEAEAIDVIRPGQSRLRRYATYYSMLSGVIWAGIVLLSVVMCLLPSRLFKLPRDHEQATNPHTYLAFLAEVPSQRQVWLEVLFVLGAWAAMSWALELSWVSVLAYVTFGIVWSSQQFIYHVRTPLHIVEGSWNLHMWRPFELLLLNTNHHLTHHRHPNVPWSHLPALAKERPWRSYLKTWAALALPPRGAEHAWPQQTIRRGPLPTPIPARFRRPEGT